MRSKIVILILSFLLVFATAPVSTQDETCPVLVQQALAQVGDACAGLGRNQACYGNNQVTATTWDNTTLVDFSAPGDTDNIVNIASLATAPFNLDEQVWGVAVLALQANLPDTLPGQNVSFVVYGDAELTNQVAPAGGITVSAQAASAANIRSGPGTNYATVGALTTGDAVTVTGRNSGGDWLQIDYRDSSAWVFATLVSLDSNIDDLPVVASDSSYTAPMQAFRFTSGIGQPLCAEAPRDGLLVQAPTGTTVNFLINGIEIEVGSTALLNVDTDDVLQTSTFDGSVSVTSAGQTQTAKPGFQVTVNAGAPPTEPEPYDYEIVRAAPVDLLPEPVSIPLVLPATVSWVDSGIAVHSGQSFTVQASGIINLWPLCETQKYDVGRPDADCAQYPLSPAGGIRNAEEDYPLPGALIASLIARIGDGAPFAVGEGGTFTASADGMLQFGINDGPDYLFDDAGAFVITVEVGE